MFLLENLEMIDINSQLEVLRTNLNGIKHEDVEVDGDTTLVDVLIDISNVTKGKNVKKQN